MKNLFVKMLIIVALCLLVLSLGSCGNAIKGDEAKALINDFFASVAAEDYDKAESLIHPDLTVDLETFFLEVEKTENVDFQEGIEIEKYTGFYSAFYDSTVSGSAYELTMITNVGDKEVMFTIQIVKNKNGYGIYNLNLDM